MNEVNEEIPEKNNVNEEIPEKQQQQQQQNLICKHINYGCEIPCKFYLLVIPFQSCLEK